jgi:hypothetical protein
MPEEVNEVGDEPIQEAVGEGESTEDTFDMEEALNGDRGYGTEHDITFDDEEEESEEEESDNEGDGAEEEPESAESTEETQQPEVYILPINGEDQEFTLAELKTMASKVAGSDQRFSEAAEQRRQVEDAYKALRENPFEFMSKMGLDTRELTEKFLTKEYEIESMSPEQKEAYTNAKKVKDYEQKELTRSEQEKELVRQAEAEKAREAYDTEFTKALEGTELPKTPETVSRMARYVKQGIDSGIEISATDAAALVAEDYYGERKKTYSKMDEGQLLRALGSDVVKKLKKYDMKKIISPESGNRATRQQPRAKRKAPKARSLSDMLNSIEESL